MRQMLGDLAAGKEPRPSDIAWVRDRLIRYVAHTFPDLDADDVVQTAIVRLLSRRAGRGTEIRNPEGYVLFVARNAAIDLIRARRRRREVELDAAGDTASEEDSIARLLERHATRAAVVDGMRTLIAADDQRTIRIITAWLDMAEELGRGPSTREVERRVGVSHATVAKALKRFRALLSERS